ncbi:Glycosyl transferase family 10 [Trinorchestia longiramus]|nr:Glycosyl transferase family 10 [Trinorchestia longiramus]
MFSAFRVTYFVAIIFEVNSVYALIKDGGGSRRENLNPNLIWWTPFTGCRYSSEPITLQYLKSLDDLIQSDIIVPSERKNLLIQEGLAPIIYIQSDCDTPSERDTYVQLLQQYIKVDSYGRCLNNKELPEQLQDGVASMDHPDLAALIARYKFAVAIENTACDDYVTEKLWRPLTVGTVPLYWGSPTVTDWLPNNNSIINIRHYNSPLHLAQHINVLLQNDTLYEAHLDHKLKGEITNDFLKKTMNERVWGVGNDPDKINFIEHFECSVCRALHGQRTQPHVMEVNGQHYNCGEPVSVLQSLTETNRSDAWQEPSRSPSVKYSPWLEEWHRAKLEAKKLSMLIRSGKYSPQTYHQDILNYLITKGHFKKFPPVVHEEL